MAGAEGILSRRICLQLLVASEKIRPKLVTADEKFPMHLLLARQKHDTCIVAHGIGELQSHETGTGRHPAWVPSCYSSSSLFFWPPFFGSRPALFRASRRRYSTCPFALLMSSAAHFCMASQISESMRSGYCLRLTPKPSFLYA